MSDRERLIYNTAVEDFKRARKAAALQQLLARLTGKSADLLAYNEVRDQLGATEFIEQGIQEIPLDAIVGSVGRYRDFTRSFLPKHDSNKARWARVRTAVIDMVGMPPIDVYQVGEVYFVIDGNHRVSIARQLGTKTISARVTEVKTRVPLTPDDDADEIICKARYAQFLAQTNLDKLRPESDLFMTFCGQYRLLLEQIEAYRLVVRERVGRDVPYEEAVKRWYDEVYMPVVRMIRGQGILHYFLNRTEADIYVLLSERQEQLTEALGWEIDTEAAVADMAEEKREGFGRRLLKAVIPPELGAGPPPGEWRKLQESRRREILFADYLIAIEGTEADWRMLDRAIEYALMDQDRLLGLHVVRHKRLLNSKRVRGIRETFLKRCRDAGLVGEFAVEAGNVVDVIIKRAVWADLVMLGLERSSSLRTRSQLSNRLGQLVQRCPRPLMIIPEEARHLDGGNLLAYDGSLKADEALYVAAYFASRRPLKLTVVTVESGHTAADALDRARDYLQQQGIHDARYVLRQEPVAEAIMETAVEYDINLLIMGGFSHRPVRHFMVGSCVDRILQEFPQPILICR